MKDFFKFTLASIIGILVVGLLLIGGGIALLFSLYAPNKSEIAIHNNSIYVLELKGKVLERSQESLFDQFVGNNTYSIGLDDILLSIKKAERNDKIKGIYLDAGYFSCPMASLQEIRQALSDFKASGKFIIAYGNSYTQSTYYLASVADKLVLNPSGLISWHGLASQRIFYKDFLKKIGVEVQVFKVGTYKSAVEPYTSSEMSPADKEQTLAYIQSLWNQLVDDVSVSRRISCDSLNYLADRNMDCSAAVEYIRCGLADTLMYKDQVRDYLKTLMDIGKKEELQILTLQDVLCLKEKEMPKVKEKIAVYYAYGTIDDVLSPLGNEGIQSEKVMLDLRRLREDKTVKAVVFRVNSPGGSAFGSEQIWHELKLLQKEKPVVVSMGDYAASGGYYISCAADWIVAEPTTLTGSIGIFGMVPDLSGLLTETLSLHFDGVMTNRHADMGNIGRPLNAEEKERFQNLVDEGYDLFVRRCAEGRQMTIEEIKEIAQGRVWTGIMAKDRNLVDQLGGIDDAITVAAERAGIENYGLVNYPKKPDLWENIIYSFNPERYIQGKMGCLSEYFPQGAYSLKNLDKIDRIQARMPYDFFFSE
ncbi:MAG: signal peptide peptidase SppA [Porphyromonadaceae bacterium]|nr:signal peptide peptidase SppA [Porphyromonadaceae bacterium]